MKPVVPRWEQRLRAPQLRSGSLLGPGVAWARDADRGVVLSNLPGRFEVYAFDASLRPARLRQVTNRPQGTIGAAIAPDGEYVLWFDDVDGDEVGQTGRRFCTAVPIRSSGLGRGATWAPVSGVVV